MEREKFHAGRVRGRSQPCAHPGCPEAGEFRAPARFGQRSGFDGPGEWQWLCLEHVREFNTRYDWFKDMTPDEIAAAQTPYAGWATETGPSHGWAPICLPSGAISMIPLTRYRRASAIGHQPNALTANTCLPKTARH